VSATRTTPPRSVLPLCFPSDATVAVPGSKSEANRLLVAAALSGQEVTVTGASPSDDVRHLVAGLATLGYASAFVDEEKGIVRVGPRREGAPTSGELFCGNAGTALRFLVSVAAITEGDWLVTGDEHMQKRPVQPLVDAWLQLGVTMECNAGCPPVRVRGGTANAHEVTVDPTLSSQFVSSLLLVGAHLPKGLDITFAGELASRSYAELTCSLLERVGVTASVRAQSAHVAAGGNATTTQLDVGGDWSGMGAWSCLNHLTNSRVRASNLVTGSGQADEQLGAALTTMADSDDCTIDVEPIPDQFLNLAVVAALRKGTTRLVGAANVRVKECDRIAVMARELRKLGADLDEHPGGLTVRGGKKLRGTSIDPEADHRVAMAFALCGLCSDGISIEDPDCVNKSYPTFWTDLERVRRQHRAIALVGMRATGKTTLGKALAAQMHSTFIDTDEQFVAAHGPIASFVEANGWPAFRREEERIVADALVPGNVVATGGGAIESEVTRAVLNERASVVWLRADASLLEQRLAKDEHRPSLTGAPVVEEVADVLQKRDPLYQQAADHILDANVATAAQVTLLTSR